MARDVVSAKLDIIFKKLFTENEDMLHSFVASMLDVPQESISEIKITNPELPPETLAGKFSRLDLSLRVDDRLVNVEIQVKNDTGCPPKQESLKNLKNNSVYLHPFLSICISSRSSFVQDCFSPQR